MPATMLAALAQLAAAPALCDLSGNWTSSKKGVPADKMVHIEFFQQQGDSTFTLRATPCGAGADTIRG